MSDDVTKLRLQLARARDALNRCIYLAEILAAIAGDRNADPAGTAAEIERARAALKEISQ